MTLAHARSVAVEQAAARERTAAAARAGTTRTRALLAAGMAAGPFYLVLTAAQGLTRDGFDFARHPASLLATGDLGWVQVITFVVTGLLVLAGAAGLRRALGGRPGDRWVTRMLAVFGAGMVGAGVFSADPADGFPVGTPLGRPDEVSWHGTLHFVVAAVSFLAISVACLASVRPLAREGRRGFAAYAAVTGALFLASFAGMASGQTSRVFSVGLLVAVVLAFGWITATTARARAQR